MELKEYQKRVVNEIERFLHALADQQAAGNRKHAAQDAWDIVKRPLRLGRYEERRNGMDEDLPTICIKVPTGGGKTLLATQVLGKLYGSILRDRGGAGGGAGLVLWVVPSSQIYTDTIRRLRDRTDMYRIMLEHAASRRVEVWEKQDIARLSPARLRDCLNILVVQLASTNRETKEQLKFFKDSGGNIVDHFPPENDPQAHKALKEKVSNLDMIEDDERSGRHLCKTSIGNLVRLCRPPVILDEGHKATSQQARDTIESFNACIVVELSATPHEGANIISRVSGDELLDEEMIKLPLNVKTSGKKNWKDIVTEARDKRIALARLATRHAAETGERLIRPIVLVQVQRTGDDQRERGYVHSEDVKEYLRQNLDVPEVAIAIKTSGKDGLEDQDLLDDGCRIEWIITKSALQEGWDCPFAYILVSLDNTQSGQAMTQLVGRVLRQPFQKRLPAGFAALNESYAFCWHERPAEILRQVKKALENEGYEGETQSLIRSGGEDGGDRRPEAPSRWRREFRSLYTAPFEGKIFIPRFCVKNGREHEPLDYYRHLISRVDVSRFSYEKLAEWPVAELIREQRDRLYRITLHEEPERIADTRVDFSEPDESVLSWMAANLDFPFLSHKKLRQIVRDAYDTLLRRELGLKGKLSLAKTEIRNRLNGHIAAELDRATEKAFNALFDDGMILFYLQCAECRFEMPDSIRVERIVDGRSNSLIHDDGSLADKSLFDFAEHHSLNDLERQVALVLDRDEDILWWYRNKVGGENFWIQGHKRHRIYPDFVAQGTHEGRPQHRVFVLESKGEHLTGNPDTAYKRNIAQFYERAGNGVTWQQLGKPFKDHIFRFQVLDQGATGGEWRDVLSAVLRG